MGYLGTKPANQAVNSDQIADGAVGTNDLANSAVTPAKLDRGYLPTTGGTVTGRTIVKDDVNADKSFPFGIQNGSQDQWWLRSETTSNRFSIARNGLGNVIQADQSGRVTMPYQPSFYAYRTSGYSSGGIIPFNATLFNRGNHFNTSTGLFTCPIAGDYFVSFYSIGDSSSNIESYYIVINGSTANWEPLNSPYAQTSGHLALGHAFILPLNANDTVGIVLGNGMWYGDARGGHNGFQARLIG